MANEWQIRCTAKEHRQHKFRIMTEKAKAVKAMAELEAHAVKHDKLYYRFCTPYKLYGRTASKWKEDK